MQVQDTIDQLGPEAWPLIEFLFNATCAVTAVWLAITVFVYLRRRASNLTPVNAADKNRKAQPDFLNVDHEARAEAIQRGENFDKELERRAREEARQQAAASKGPILQRASGLVALIMSVFTIMSLITGSIFTVGRMGNLMQGYSSIEKITTAIQAHPIAFTVTTLVILVRIYTYFSQQRQKEA